MGLWLRNWEFFYFTTISQLQKNLRNWALAAKLRVFYASQPFHNCEMRVTMLRNGTRVPKSGFATVKSFAKWSFPCENWIFHALVVRSRFAVAKWESLCCEMALCAKVGFAAEKIFAERGLRLRTSFAAKCRFRRGYEISQTPVFALFLLCFCSVFAPNDFPSFLLQFLLILIIQKPILHQNKLELKHWNQN